MITADDIEAMRDRAPVIGLSGLAGSGKTTAANYLLRLGWTRVKLAGPLKDMLRAVGFTDREIEGDLKEVPNARLGGKTPRWAMQTLGTDWGRKLICDDLWVTLARGRIEDALREGHSVVVDDVRFENEAAMIRGLGGIVVGLRRAASGTTSAHESENGVAADFVFDNDGELDHLHDLIGYIAERQAVYAGR